MKRTASPMSGKIYLLAVNAVFLYSCSQELVPSHHYAYAPSGVNASFLNKKKQLRVSTNLTIAPATKDEGNGTTTVEALNLGAHVRAAYAITDHFGVTAAYWAGWEKDKYNQARNEAESISYKREQGEISAGYFTPVNKKKNIFLEFYGGYGLGKNNTTEVYKDAYYGGGSFSNNYNLFYIQPAVAFHHKKFLRAGISLRTSLIKFGKAATTYSRDFLQDYDVRLDDLDKRTFIFLQPALSVRLAVSKKGNLHLNMEINGSLRLSEYPFYTRGGIGMIGITYSPFLTK